MDRFDAHDLFDKLRRFCDFYLRCLGGLGNVIPGTFQYGRFRTYELQKRYLGVERHLLIGLPCAYGRNHVLEDFSRPFRFLVGKDGLRPLGQMDAGISFELPEDRLVQFFRNMGHDRCHELQGAVEDVV